MLRGDRTDGAAPLDRRSFLRTAGIVSAIAPLMGIPGGLLAAPAEAAPGGLDSTGRAFASKDPWPATPGYNFAFIADRTGSSVLLPARSGANDASAFLGNTVTWTGSAEGNVAEMVAAFDDALDNDVDGIVCAFSGSSAFNALTATALAAGTPVIAFNSGARAGTGNNALAYIGQDHQGAGAALAQRVLSGRDAPGHVVGLLSTGASWGEQLRFAGAGAAFRRSGARVDKLIVGAGTTTSPATGASTKARDQIFAWWREHQATKPYFFGTGSATSRALAGAMKDTAMVAEGARGAGFDVDVAVLQAVAAGRMDFTLDQQAYLQGFLPVLALFLYNMTGGLVRPASVDTGQHPVTSANVGRYLLHSDSWEGTSSRPLVITPPHRIRP
ncbi:MAG TPA: substrate-binding domain-containing protein [Acidimicrobiales bacterium]|nr:substrate-binding domain-containing protein [Acidimicrobiales bacterium]